MTDILFTISIENFRNIKTVNYIFKTGITLLKGCSGVGKTTIFSAIEWCLYGKNKNVIPIGSKGVKTSVNMKICGLSILRRKNKDILKVIVENENLELTDDDAQSFIESIFGSRDKFFVLSYIEQKKYTRFFDMKNNERLSFLNMLSFEDKENEINEFKNKIDNQIKNFETEVKENELLSSYESKKLSEINIEDCIENVTENMFNNNDLPNLKFELNKLNKLKNSYLVKNTMIYELKKNIQDKKDYIKYIIILPESEIKDYHDQLSILQDVRRKLSTKIELTDQVVNFQKQFDTIFGKYELSETSIVEQDLFEQAEINSIKCIEIKLKEYTKICSTLNINYLSLTEDCLSKLKSDLKFKIDNSKKRNEYERYIKMISLKQKELDSIPDVNYEQEISKIKKAIEIGICYTCPSCCKLLYFKDSKLHITEKDDYQIVDKTKLQTLQEFKKKKADLLIEIKSLTDGLNLMFKEIPDNISENVKELEVKLNLLYKLEIVEEPSISSEMMIDFNKMKRLYLEIFNKHSEISKLNLEQHYDLVEINKDINFFKSQIKNNSENIIKLNESIKDISDFESRLNSIEIENINIHTIDNEIKDLEIKILETEKRFEKLKLSFEINKLKSSIRLYETNISVLNDHIITLNNLKGNITLLECIFLDNKIKSINLCLNKFLSELNIKYSIYLKLIKENKSKNVRTGVFTQIVYDGASFSDLSFFSGGEIERLSFALSLCFNHLFNGLFVIFDEIFSSLDSNLRFKCIELMKSLNINAIIISHEEIEGYYDGQVLEIK